MSSRSLITLGSLALVLGRTAPAAAQSAGLTSDPTSLLWGRQFTEWFYSAEVDSIFTRMDADSQKETGSPADMLKLLSEVQQQGGIETDVISEEVRPDTAVAGGYRYVRRVHFSNVPQFVVRLVWVINQERKIAGFGIRPEESGGN
jgi:hypothetical protein